MKTKNLLVLLEREMETVKDLRRDLQATNMTLMDVIESKRWTEKRIDVLAEDVETWRNRATAFEQQFSGLGLLDAEGDALL